MPLGTIADVLAAAAAAGRRDPVVVGRAPARPGRARAGAGPRPAVARCPARPGARGPVRCRRRRRPPVPARTVATVAATSRRTTWSPRSRRTCWRSARSSTRAARRDGTEFWVLFHGAVGYDGDGPDRDLRAVRGGGRPRRLASCCAQEPAQTHGVRAGHRRRLPVPADHRRVRRAGDLVRVGRAAHGGPEREIYPVPWSDEGVVAHVAPTRRLTLPLGQGATLVACLISPRTPRHSPLTDPGPHARAARRRRHRPRRRCTRPPAARSSTTAAGAEQLAPGQDADIDLRWLVRHPRARRRSGRPVRSSQPRAPAPADRRLLPRPHARRDRRPARARHPGAQPGRASPATSGRGSTTTTWSPSAGTASRWVRFDPELNMAENWFGFDSHDMATGLGAPFETAAEVWLAHRRDGLDVVDLRRRPVAARAVRPGVRPRVRGHRARAPAARRAAALGRLGRHPARDADARRTSWTGSPTRSRSCSSPPTAARRAAPRRRWRTGTRPTRGCTPAAES